MVKVNVTLIFLGIITTLIISLDADGICNMSIDGLESCKPAIQNGESVDDPSSDCCTALQKADFKCLCTYKDSIMLKTMDINSTRAMALPQTCGITTVPIKCSKSGRHG